VNYLCVSETLKLHNTCESPVNKLLKFMKLAILGATGLVGKAILQVLSERNKAHTFEILPCATPASVGKEFLWEGKSLRVKSVEEVISLNPEYAIFSAGGDASKLYAPQFVVAGATVIDNSSAWRMEPNIPLIVPEINASDAQSAKIIANPNCSTIQLVMVLAPLARNYGLKRVVVSTYQSVSGSGKKGLDQLQMERQGDNSHPLYPWPIDLNCIPHCDVFMENDYTREEMKIIRETRKILHLDTLKITATSVRVPVSSGHSESVNIELNAPAEIQDIRNLLSDSPGIIVQDKPSENLYPMPLYSAGNDQVFVGRIRKDESLDNAINLWITADNLRKGAATNAVQILQYLLKERHGIA